MRLFKISFRTVTKKEDKNDIPNIPEGKLGKDYMKGPVLVFSSR